MREFKATFIFTSRPSLEETPREERVSTSIPLPEAANEQPDLRGELVRLGQLAAGLTQYSLFLHCPEADLRNYPIAQGDPVPLRESRHAIVLYFNSVSAYPRNIILYFYAPIMTPFSEWKKKHFFYDTYGSIEQQEFANQIRDFVEPLLTLLQNAGSQYCFTGFKPRESLGRQAKRLNKLYSKRAKEVAAAQRQQKRLAEKLAAQSARQQNDGAEGPTIHGAGRLPGARPGVYKGVQMRSQLEIRFAAELDERGIRWVYEGEALGAAQYLVDFYLPDLGVWVEVKGQLSAKDRQVLPDVAAVLKKERQQRLLMYSGSGKCYVINPSGFREIERKHFWTEVMK